MSKTTGKPLAFTSIRSQQGGAALLRKIGLYDSSRLSQKAAAALTRMNNKIAKLDVKATAVEMSELPEIAREIDNNVVITLSGIDAPVEGSEFTLRELRGLDRTMQTVRGELVNNLGQLSELDKSIVTKETRLKNLSQDDDKRPEIERSLRDLRSEREPHQLFQQR